jgi:chorismate mutase/prephenate dehydrogenase
MQRHPDPSPALEALSPLSIIGAHGSMGAWFTGMLRQRGFVVLEIDQTTPADERHSALTQSRSVLFSVPISATASTVTETLPLLDQDALVLDITSLKSTPLEAMLQHPGEVLGLHPMCAPSEYGLLDQPVVVCCGRSGPKTELFLDVLRGLGARLVPMTANYHDKLMAIVQGLNHFNSIVFAHSLKAIGISVEETMEVASPVYQLRMQLMGRIVAQNPLLYVDIELENPFVPEVLAAYTASLQRFKAAIEQDSRDECLRFFSEAAESFGPYRHEAMRESDSLLRLWHQQTKPTDQKLPSRTQPQADLQTSERDE